jgi:hypothetical protein
MFHPTLDKDVDMSVSERISDHNELLGLVQVPVEVLKQL